MMHRLTFWVWALAVGFSLSIWVCVFLALSVWRG
jgi:hypothetical protein